MADKRWLEQRGLTWYAVKDVPRPLRATLGKRRFVKSLHTQDLRVAQASRHHALAEFAGEIAAAGRKTSASPYVDAGLAWRDTLRGIDRRDPAMVARFNGDPEGPWGRPGDPPLAPHEVSRQIAEMVLQDQVEDVALESGDEAAGVLYRVAHGEATPLLHSVDAWLAEGGRKGPLKERTRRQYRSDVEALEDWAKRKDVPPLLEAFTPRRVGDFITGMVGEAVHRKTANRRISAASSYWRWLVKRGVVASNPWTGQSLSKHAPAPDEAQRPFTDAEVATLLAGPAGPELVDAMRVAALSGMRIDEIFRLKVSDCADDTFRVREAKTAAGVRRVPTHPDLAAIVSRRTTGKEPSDYLFHERGTTTPAGAERSMPVSKRFTRYRRQLKVDDVMPGRRQSRVTFHSFRRWFITKAREGYDQAVVAAIVGHELGNITDDTYSGGPSETRKRDCVVSVRLP